MPLPEVVQADLAQGSAPPLSPTCHYLFYAFNMHHKGAETLNQNNNEAHEAGLIVLLSTTTTTKYFFNFIDTTSLVLQ